LNATVIALKLLVALIVLTSSPLILKRRWRLFLAVPLSVFQAFIPGSQVAGVPIPLAFWGGLMLWPELVTEFKALIQWKPTACVFGITVLYAVSLLWSPDRKLGLQPIGYFAEFLVIFAAVVTEGRRDERLVLRLLKVTMAMALVEAALVVVGRLFPGVKLSLLLHPIARLFLSANIIDNLFSGNFNGVMDPAKSGGFFIDANVASTFLGVSACTAFGLALHLRRQWVAAIGAALLGAVAFAGSKAGLMLAAALPILMLHFISLRYRGWRNRLRMAMVAIVLVGTAAWFGPKAILIGDTGTYRALSAFVQRSDMTFAARELIWAYGAQAFMEHPIKGQGFGGWQDEFPKYAHKVGIQDDLPPHNTIIYLWSQGGTLAALLGLGFIFQVLKLGVRQMGERFAAAFGLNLAMTAAFLWTFVGGMGQNYGLLGEAHMSPLLATLLALGYLHRRALSLPTKDDSIVVVGEPYGESAAVGARYTTGSLP